MSNWVPSHDDLGNHPKRKKLSRRLDMRPWETVGMLHYLWWWVLQYAPDGDLSGFDATEIADGIEWPGDPDELTQALIHAGFIDSDMRVHDWDDNGGRLFKYRQANASRMRDTRAKHVRNTCDAQVAHVQGRGEERRVEEKTESKTLVGKPTPRKQSFNGQAQSLFDHWQRVFAREAERMTFTADRKRCVEARLREGITPDTIKAAVEAARSDSWWNGEGDGEWKADLKTICGKGSTVERLAFGKDRTTNPHDLRVRNLRELRQRMGDPAVKSMCETPELWQEVLGA